jgi:HEPN domain-containing protein
MSDTAPLSSPSLQYICRSFRDVADRDYIAARHLYRIGLSQQFLWAALQSLEKYLKGILLFSRRSVLGYRHVPATLFEELAKITDVPFQFPSDLRKYLEYLEAYGPDRYFEKPYVLAGDELLQLDRAVWHVRRYCQPMPRATRTLPSGRSVDMFVAAIAGINASSPERAHAFRISGGYLEAVLRDRSHEQRPSLVWKNFFYGSYTKRAIRFTRRFHTANPTTFLFPEAYSELESLMAFSKPVRDYFQARNRARPKK